MLPVGGEPQELRALWVAGKWQVLGESRKLRVRRELRKS
ncbi:hypothetical protein L083_4487 [Actinoplanes sp. N902-109]|nr:hypothetical protein L083_4487 [Actinoplanes sp. N902-109]